MPTDEIHSAIESIGVSGSFLLWLKPAGEWDIDESGDFRYLEADVLVDAWLFKPIAHGTSVHFDVSCVGGGELAILEKNVGHEFPISDSELGCVHAVTVLDEGKEPPFDVHLGSINQLMVIEPGNDEHVQFGDGQLSREDALLAFKTLGDWLNYEVAV